MSNLTKIIRTSTNSLFLPNAIFGYRMLISFVLAGSLQGHKSFKRQVADRFVMGSCRHFGVIFGNPVQNDAVCEKLGDIFNIRSN